MPPKKRLISKREEYEQITAPSVYALNEIFRSSDSRLLSQYII